jgi:hypothetical protein
VYVMTLVPPRENEYEVWVNDCIKPPRLLLVVFTDGDRPFKVLDPTQGNADIFSAGDFLEILDYLCEEDYVRVGGRMKVEDDTDDDDW